MKTQKNVSVADAIELVFNYINLDYVYKKEQDGSVVFECPKETVSLKRVGSFVRVTTSIKEP